MLDQLSQAIVSGGVRTSAAVESLCADLIALREKHPKATDDNKAYSQALKHLQKAFDVLQSADL